MAEAIVKRAGNPVDDAGTTRRLAALETEVERLNGEIVRLEEETVFLHRLLESKPKDSLPPGSAPS